MPVEDILTESGDFLITESGDFLETEASSGFAGGDVSLLMLLGVG